MAEVPEEAQAAAAEEILEAQAEVPEEAGIQEVPEAAAEIPEVLEAAAETQEVPEEAAAEIPEVLEEAEAGTQEEQAEVPEGIPAEAVGEASQRQRRKYQKEFRNTEQTIARIIVEIIILIMNEVAGNE